MAIIDLFKRRFDHPLDVVEVKQVYEQGVTFPVLCKLSDGFDGIVKYPRNPFGLNALINEWVGNSLADLVDLTIPEYGQCYMFKEVIHETNENEEIDEANCGNCFFSYHLSKTAQPNRFVLSKASNKETERLLLLDHLISNTDRHSGNILYEISENNRVFFIDCSHIMMPSNRNMNYDLDVEWELSDAAILSDEMLADKKDNLYDLLCNTMLYDEVKRIKNPFTLDKLDAVRQSIPEEWITDSTIRRIDDMFMILATRLNRLDDIANMIANERRNGNWKRS